VYDIITIVRNSILLKNITGTLTTTTDATISSNVLYEYKLLGVVTGVGSSAFCTPSSCGYFEDTKTEEVTVQETNSHSVTESPYADTITETVTCEDIATDSVGETPTDYSDTVTDTVTCADTVYSSMATAQDFEYYLGSSAGMVYSYNEDEYGDSGTAINSYWKSKRIDFSDLYQQYLGTWKTIDYVNLTYVDRGEHTVTISISTDGGVAWDNLTKTFGSDTGKLAEKSFHFYKSGRFFNFKVANNSSTEDFQWLRLTVHFVPGAEQFATA